MARIRTPKRLASELSDPPEVRIVKASLCDAMDALRRGPGGNSRMYEEVARMNGYASSYDEALQFFTEGTAREWFEMVWPDMDYDWLLDKLLAKYGPEAHGVAEEEPRDRKIECVIKYGDLNIALVG